MTFDQKLEIFSKIIEFKDNNFINYLLSNSFLTCCILEALDNPKDIQDYFNRLEFPLDYKTHTLFEQKLYIFKKYASAKQLEYVYVSASHILTKLNYVDSLKEILIIISQLPKI